MMCGGAAGWLAKWSFYFKQKLFTYMFQKKKNILENYTK